MKNNLEELKKEFETRYVFLDKEGYPYIKYSEVFWQWITGNFVPKGECEELKAENEKLESEATKYRCTILEDSLKKQRLEKALAEAQKDLFQEFESTIVSHVNLFCAEEDSEIQKFAEALLKALDSGKKQYGIEPQQPSKQQQSEEKI